MQIHCRDTTEPSLLAHEILTARPYAFLDDGEAVDRRTNAVPLRRGLPVDPAEMGRLERSAIDRVREEIAPHPRTADELHDLLSALVLTSARAEWEPLFVELESRGRACRCLDTSGERWHVTEAAGAVAEPCDSDTVTEILRGHLEMHSPVTAPQLAVITGVGLGAVRSALAALELEGFALQGCFTDAHLSEPEWSSRRLLSRMHSYSRRTRRREIEPVTPEALVRFWLRWQHVAPGSQVRGRAGLATVLEQLQGASAAVAAWEPDILGRRILDYEPAWLDERCLSGDVSWLRIVPPTIDDPDKRRSGPSKATPITLAFRDDLAWLIAAVRGDQAACQPQLGPVAEIVETLGDRGACFASELADSTGRLRADIESALWDGVARGLLTSDGFAAIRALSERSGRSSSHQRRRARLRRGAPPPDRAAGRWSLVPAVQSEHDHDELAEALAEQLLAVLGSSSTTSWRTKARRCAGATSSGHCAGWRTAVRSEGAASSTGSAASSSPSPRRSKVSRPSAGSVRPIAPSPSTEPIH